MVDLIMDAEMTFGEEDDEIEIQDLTPTAEDRSTSLGERWFSL